MTTEAPPKRYATSAMVPHLMEQVACATKQEVRDWAMHAEASYESKGKLGRLWCNDCMPEHMAKMEMQGLCRRHEINGPGFEPVEDTSDFEVVN